MLAGPGGAHRGSLGSLRSSDVWAFDFVISRSWRSSSVSAVGARGPQKTTQDEPQWIVAQRLLSHLQYLDSVKSSAKDLSLPKLEITINHNTTKGTNK